MKNKNYANRGKKLERIIDQTNEYYMNKGLADIRKIPSPFKVLRPQGKLMLGHWDKGTWVDYSGVYDGKSIVFDAKETKGKSFPLANLHEHQYNLLKSWHYKGARSFLIVYFSEEDKYYLVLFKELEWAVKRSKEGGRKSIALYEFNELGIELKYSDGILDYIKYL